ncbi:DNA replication licensing factor MCM4 [Daldinia childiae]|uniref:DNA replication licensing factor MCM4 n=1 Tax=Daldinia childiae TaxID=326645 RepID=UPI001446917B|nr:DNA replication licensing factor MCM4 [Daldinia childiae]KAF3066499.1 DNA replication licensing factor MCM4 [Daldinia childiae]
MQIIHNRCEFEDKQVIKLQETPDEVPAGQTPHSVSVCVYNELVDFCKAGDRIKVTGIYRVSPVRVNPRQRSVKSIFKTFVDVVHVAKVDNKKMDIDISILDDGANDEENNIEETRNISPEEEEKIKATAARPDIYELLARSLAPSVYEMDDVKKGILLQMFGGTNKTFEKGGSPKYRGDINVLLCGDPSTSKSQLLKYIHKIAPRGVYTSGKGSSAVGLTAYVSRDPETRQLVLESGALVLSDGGVCCIDEFDKMSDSTRSVLHEVMEQQTVSVAKAGIITTLNARTSILASANPIGSRYNPDLPVPQNIDLPPTLLSRFDLVYLILDRVNESADRRLARHLLSMYLEDTPQSAPSINEILVSCGVLNVLHLVRSYSHPPDVDQDASQALVDAYVNMRKLGQDVRAAEKRITATTRQLESMIRLAEAHAKMRLSTTVTKADVFEAERLIQSALKTAATDSQGRIDMSLLTEGTSAAERKRKTELKEAILRLLDELTSSGQNVRWSEVSKRLNEGASVPIEPADFAETMRALEMEGSVMISGEGARRSVRRVTDKVSVTPSSNLISEAEAQKLAAFPELKEKGFQAPKSQTREHVKKPINVPFAFQTPASGVFDNNAHEVLCPGSLWRRGLRCDDLGFGISVGQHRGGHVPFDVDITDALANAWKNIGKGELNLILRIRDSPHDLAQPRGKQYWAPKPESIFYKPTSGIWQPVWLEVLPRIRIGDSRAGTILKSNNISEGLLEATVAVLGRRAGHGYSVEIEGYLYSVSVAKTKENLPSDKDYVSINLGLSLSDDQKSNAPPTLAQDAPYYDSHSWREDKLIDEVKTYTGFRSIDWNRGDRTLRLNDKPLFQALTLDQGYWPETGLTPPSPDSLRLDIELTKKMGFNGLGFLVWGEMANAYEFNEDYAERFSQEWVEAVKRDINHPSIVTWTPVNDQRNHIRSLYHITKTLDPTRPVNDNCGWEHVITDLSTFHDYSDAPDLSKTCATLEGILGKKLADRDFFVGPLTLKDGRTDSGTKHREGAPVICTEFGGVNIAPRKGAESGDGDWGYTTASDPKDLLKRLEALMQAVVQGGHICGFVYTQLSDVEQEVNGLYSFDRREKIPADEVSKLIEAARKTYFDNLAKGT